MKKTAGTLKTTQKDKISTVASLELALDLIEEDPNQPRNEFDPVTLQELAAVSYTHLTLPTSDLV